MSDAAGGETRPSYFVGVVRGLLPDVLFSTHQTETAQDRLQAERPAVEMACAYLSGDRTAAVRAAYGFYRDDERVHHAAQQRRGRGPLTSPHTIEGLYGKSLNLTASRVDTFYSCRFAFFMQYGLKAKAAPHGGGSTRSETGTFIHYVLEHALTVLLGKGAGGAARRAAGQRAVRSCLPHGGPAVCAGRNWARMEKQDRALSLSVRAADAHGCSSILDNVIDELRVSDFAPIDYEVDVSRFGGDLPPVRCARRAGRFQCPSARQGGSRGRVYQKRAAVLCA